MTFEQEMNQFFSGYSEKARVEVETWPPHQDAVTKKDVELAQRIALEVIQKDYPKDKKLARILGPYLEP